MARLPRRAKSSQWLSLAIGASIVHFESVRAFLQRWLVTAAGVMLASAIVRGIDYGSFGSLLAASLLLGIFNAVLRPIMLILSLPLLLMTLGLFTFVVNAVLLLLVGSIVKSFYVAGFWAALWGGIVISIVSFIANGLIGKPVKRPAASESPASERKPPPGKGPIIDV
jgi:putative membrane protein